MIARGGGRRGLPEISDPPPTSNGAAAVRLRHGTTRSLRGTRNGFQGLGRARFCKRTGFILNL